MKNLVSPMKEVFLPLILFLGFFIVESFGILGEVLLAVVMILIMIFTWLVVYHKREIWLYIIGAILGLIIEVGLRYFGYQQVWNNASLFGVPYWLPLTWGAGFVLITRLGIFIRRIRT